MLMLYGTGLCQMKRNEGVHKVFVFCVFFCVQESTRPATTTLLTQKVGHTTPQPPTNARATTLPRPRATTPQPPTVPRATTTHPGPVTEDVRHTTPQPPTRAQATKKIRISPPSAFPNSPPAFSDGPSVSSGASGSAPGKDSKGTTQCHNDANRMAFEVT